MKVLVINQPINNRGDESAHKALLRSLLKEVPNAEVVVLFENEKTDSIRQFSVLSNQITYVNTSYNPLKTKGLSFSVNVGLKHGFHFLWSIQPYIRNLLKLYKEADAILCAPGGMCLGGFQNWHHLFLLMLAKYVKKPLFYYGRSIGPFPTSSKDNIKFKKLATEILQYSLFVSLRDRKSETHAKGIGLENFISVVDSAFLDSPVCDIPKEIVFQIEGSRYVVFVPNLLIWHPAYKGRLQKECLVNFYVDIVRTVFDRFPNHKIVMLPQTFNYSSDDENDVNLFRAISNVANDNRLVVVDDIYSSDIQQSLIAKSDFMIGMRYHSIVFALNNATPFVALSYEHKISGLLETLGKTEALVEIEETIMTPEGRNSILRQIADRLFLTEKNIEVQKKAKGIALNGFVNFCNKLGELAK